MRFASLRAALALGWATGLAGCGTLPAPGSAPATASGLPLESCPFCRLAPAEIVDSDGPCLAVRDAHPASPGHTLIMPRRHVASFRDLTPEEWSAMARLARRLAAALQAEDPSIAGFNYGTNDGPAAGQTIPHCHFHLIPRRPGDVPNPRGGIRKAVSAR